MKYIFCQYKLTMHKKQQKAKNDIINLQNIQVLQPTAGGIIRTFSNPVCKETFHSLPRIYGKKKRKINLVLSPEKQSHARSNKQINSKKEISLAESQSKSKVRRTNSQSFHGTTKYNALQGNRLNVVSEPKNKTRVKFNTTARHNLPEIRKFNLQDLQSHHKVSLQGIATRTNFRMTGLQKIIEQNQKLRSQNQSKCNSARDKKQKSHSPDQQQQGNIFNNSNVKTLKNKYKHQSKPHKFYIQQQQSDDEHQDKKGYEKQKNQSARFKTQGNYSPSESLQSSKVKQIGKSQNTRFYELNMTQKSWNKQVLHRKGSQLSNGLFRIPEEDEYSDYLRGYQCVDKNFNIKSIVQRPGFKVEKNQKGVYFGEFNKEMEKHGQGININDKQIFQGSYVKDIKTSGCERNIDGVYIGQFQNGKRSGHGVFKWNNGQVFEGNWSGGMKNGYGVWRSPKGSYYEGQWANNRQHGPGLFKHKTSTYKGEFKNFLKDGFGQQNFANGDKYVGQYKEGRPHGKGKYSWFQSGFYEGTFNQGMREGKGKWVSQNNTYEGHFKADFKHGLGKQTYPSGDYFEGEFNQGDRSNGKLYDKYKNVIEVIRPK